MFILSDDLLFYLVNFLNTLDIINLKRTSRRLYNIIKRKDLKITKNEELKSVEFILKNRLFITPIFNTYVDEDNIDIDIAIHQKGKETIIIKSIRDIIYGDLYKIKIYKQIIFIGTDNNIIAFDLKFPNRPLFIIQEFDDFEIYNNCFLLIVRGTFVLLDIDQKFKHVFTIHNFSSKLGLNDINFVQSENNVYFFYNSKEVFYYYKQQYFKINHIFNSVKYIKIYKNRLYIIDGVFLSNESNVFIFILDQRDYLDFFKIQAHLCRIEIHNDHIYTCIKDNRYVLYILIYNLKGVLRYKIKMGYFYPNDFCICDKTGEILVSDYQGLLSIK